jgi:hypothetical protein
MDEATKLLLTLITSPLVKRDQFGGPGLVRLCQSRTTLLELTAQAAGEWLASQKNEG